MIALCTLATLCVATLDEPFEDVGFEEALSKAKKSERVVFVDFYTDWCTPCKKLDATTWKDERVRAWLAEHTVALKIDAEREVELADTYQVNAYPTLLFVSADGSALDRIVGYVDADDFLSQAADALAGKTAVDRAEEELSGHEQDPTLRSDLADELARAGRYEEALEHYLWCFDHGLEHRPSYSGVRTSFLLSDIQRLGQSYPRAFAELRLRRDRLKDAVFAGEATRRELVDFTALNDALDQPELSLAAFDALKEQERHVAARSIVYRIDDRLLELRRYDDLLRFGGRDRAYFENEVRQFDVLSQRHRDRARARGRDVERMLAFMRSQTVDEGCVCFEVLLGCARPDEAALVADDVLKFDAERTTYWKLVDHAVRAGDPKAAERIARRGLDELPDEEAELLRRAVERKLDRELDQEPPSTD